MHILSDRHSNSFFIHFNLIISLLSQNSVTSSLRDFPFHSYPMPANGSGQCISLEGDYIAACRDADLVRILLLGEKVHDGICVREKFSRCECMCNIFLCHYEHCVCAFLACFGVPLCHSPKIFSKRFLPNLGRRCIIRQFFVTQNGLPGEGVDHGIGIVFKVHRDLCVLHQLGWYVYRVEQGLLF